MSENIQRSTGRAPGYRLDRGGAPADPGPYIGEVRNNIDPTRSGRLQVWIEEFAGNDKNDSTLWRTVSYLSPFYGITQPVDGDAGEGSFIGNPHTYGMWFTPPDIGVRVLCFFAGGDPNQGFYVGCIPEIGVNHMIPAIGADPNAYREDTYQRDLFANAERVPTVEINTRNLAVFDDPKFYDKPKPIHAIVAALMWQQGLINDPVRGPIGSTSQRESPSSVYGISTPGKPIYASGVSEAEVKQKLDSGELRAADVAVVGRMGGHTLVMDDGNIQGRDALVRIRTAKGHQIMLSDSGDCIHIIHSNGQAWLEIGNEGTLDVYATNSVNVRTNGTINLHADQDINLYAGGNITAEANVNMRIESRDTMEFMSAKQITMYGQTDLQVLMDGTIAVKASGGASVDGGSQLDLNAGTVYLNTNGSLPTTQLKPTTINLFPDTKFDPEQGWTASDVDLASVVTRAPTHEPWTLHNQGVLITTSLSTPEETESPTPPEGWNVSAR